MKGIVVDIKNEYCYIMDSDNIVHKLINISSYYIGQRIDFIANKNTSFFSANLSVMKYLSVAAVFVIAAIPVLIYFISANNLIYVNVEINPSIYLTINKDYKVKKAEGKNNDGQNVLKDLDLKNKSIEFALEKIVKNVEDKGYIKDKNSTVAIAVTSQEVKDHIVLSGFYDELQKNNNSIELFFLTKKEWKEILKENNSPAKVELIKNFQQKLK